LGWSKKWRKKKMESPKFRLVSQGVAPEIWHPGARPPGRQAEAPDDRASRYYLPTPGRGKYVGSDEVVSNPALKAQQKISKVRIFQIIVIIARVERGGKT
jgi:hypothetical protein